MCGIRDDGQEIFDESLLNLFKMFKDGEEAEAGEPIDNEGIKKEFCDYINNNISRIIKGEEEFLN